MNTLLLPERAESLEASRAPDYPRVNHDAIDRYLESIQDTYYYIEWADEYGEPGYTTPEKGILLANWNDFHRNLVEVLEAAGYECEYPDEWLIDYESSPPKAYRTSPDCYGWEPQIAYCDGYVLTPDSDASEWLEEFMNSDRLLPSHMSHIVDDCDEDESPWLPFPEDQDEYLETGFHPGQNDNPTKARKALAIALGKFEPTCKYANGDDIPGVDTILVSHGCGQFDQAWKLYYRLND